MIKTITILICHTLLLATTVWGQVKDVKFRNITTEAGLSHERVYCTLQDSKGFIWIGTRDGLNVYDGYNFTTYNEVDSGGLSSQHIQVLHEDSKGYIWIGTYDGGLNRFDRYTRTFETFRHNPDDPNSIGSDNIYAIHEDSHGKIWIGTYGGGLCRFNEKEHNFTVFKNDQNQRNSLSNDAVFDIIEDKNGKLWLATFGGGLCSFDPDSNTFFRYQYKASETNGLPTNDLYALCKDPAGNIWIGTYGKGLVKLDPETGNFKTYHQVNASHSISSNYILSLATDHLGNLWLATKDGGLSYMDVQTEKFHVFKKNPINKHALHTDYINSIYLDRSGMLWVATDDDGLYTANAQAIIFDNYIGDGKHIPGFAAKSVTSVYEDKQQHIWVGTFGEGLYRFDQQLQQIDNYTNDFFSEDGIASNFITAIAEDSAHNIWVGTLNEGLCRYNPATGEWKTYVQADVEGSLSNNTINTLYIDKQHHLWVGTDGGGLCRFNTETESFTVYQHNPYAPARSLVGNAVKTIFEDEGSLWIGTKYSGISRMELATGNMQNFQYSGEKESLLSSNEIVDILKDKQGNLWVGTFDKGICVLNLKEQTREIINTEEALSSDNICGMQLADDGAVWVSTTKGLNRIHPVEHSVQKFTADDGLYNTEFVQWAYCMNEHHDLFLGYLGGFVRFNPSLLQKRAYDPPVYVTSFLLFNQKLALDTPNFALDHIELEHHDNFFEFEFALLDYKDPVENQYAYIMENLDHDWKYVAHRRIASYTNLDAGTYIFKVKAKGKNGEWHEITHPITIVIHPAWYNTWWFRAAIALLTLGLGFLYYYNKITTIRERNEELERLVEERTVELLDKNEEINAQKENIEVQNKQLVEIQAIIEERNTELRNVNEELEDRVEQRTKELITANIQLQKANEELDTFVYRSYHDIIGPISRIQGLCYVASLEIKDEAGLEYIQRLSENIDHAKNTLLRVLSIYSIRNYEVTIADVDVLELVYGLIAQFEKQYNLSNVSVNYDEDFHRLIKSDHTLLRIVLLNLFENAAKYSRMEEDSFIQVNIQKSSGEIGLQMLDNGRGIPAKVRNKVFSMFFRADNDRSGIGLGLYLAKIAVQKLKGTIQYQHTAQNETLFDLRIPLAPVSGNVTENSIVSKADRDK